MHGEIRIVTENALIAMPETAIRFFPDIGAHLLLPRRPTASDCGWSLTGARLHGADAVAVRLARTT